MDYATYFKTWNSDRCAYGHITQSSADAYTRLVAPALEIIGRKSLKALTYDDVDSCYRKLVRTHGPTRVRNLSIQICKSLHDATQRRMIAANPAASVEAPKAKRKVKTTTLSEAQLSDLLRASQAWGATGRICRAIVYTGMRRGEACGVQWQDVDLRAGTVTIRRQVAMVGAIPHVSPVKTEKAARTITLPAALLEELRPLQGAPTAWVFPNQYGRNRNPDQLSKDVRELFDGIDLDFSLHDLRHAHATYLLQQKQPIKAVSERLGHSNVQITLGIYTHVMPGDDAKLACAMDALL